MSLIAKIDYSGFVSTFPDQNGGQTDYADVYIIIIDTATGQPANGNNCVVKYTINENGNSYQQQVTIAGQSARIFSGIVNNSGYNSLGEQIFSYNVTFSCDSLTPGDGEVTPTMCDLVIKSLKVNKPESAPGAKDAEVLVNASSGNGPLTYSSDNTNFLASPLITGLSGGNQTFYVKDGIGCTAQASVNVPVLSNLLAADPSVAINGNNVCRWNAAFNPIVFTYQRKDFTVTAVQQDTQTGLALVSLNADVSTIIPGDMVYLHAGNYNNTVKVVKVYAPGQLLVNLPFNGTATGFININRLRPYYKMLTRITYIDKLTGTQQTITASNRPDSKGVTRADISNFLQSLLTAQDESDFTRINFRDDNLSASYQVAYVEYWEDGTAEEHTSDFITINHPFYVLYAARQLGSRYGGNLAEYVPFSHTPAGADKARWVTDFEEPAFSNGYPFDIGFIYSDDLIGRNLFAEFTLMDINRNPLEGGPQTAYLLNDDGSWLLNQDGSKMAIAKPGVLTIPVPEQLGLNRLLINQAFAPEVYFIAVALKYTEGDVTTTVTRDQIIRVDDAVDDQSVYLRWIGLSGSWNYYRFVYNQEVSLDVQNAVIIKNYVSDWENQNSIEEVISKTAGQKMKVFAEDLSVADIKGLQSVKYSPKVQMLVSKNPVKWQTIVINTATYSEYETRNGRAPFSVTFNLPAINIQTQ